MGKSKDLATGETRFVNTAGDTMTGNLAINNASGSQVALHRSDTTIANDDLVGQIIMSGDDADSNASGTRGFIRGRSQGTGGGLKMEFGTAGGGVVMGDPRMTINADGYVTTPYQPAFKVYVGSTGWVDIVHNATRRIPFNAETYDVGGCFNTSTSTFTAPVSGYYFFYASVYTHNGAGVKVLEFYTGGNDPASGGTTMALTQDDGALGTMQLSTTHYFNAGEKMAAYFYLSNDVNTGVYSSNNPAYSHFLGYLIG